jgi:hypothetical protein
LRATAARFADQIGIDTATAEGMVAKSIAKRLY